MEEYKKPSLIDRIKNWWKQRNVKALETGQSESEYNNSIGNFDKALKVDDPPTLFPEGTMDYALNQYLGAILYQTQNGQQYNSYKALTDLAGISNGAPGNNEINESNLINSLRNARDINVNRQIDNKTGNVFFYHIKKNHMDMEKISKRLYLNCKRENIVLLAGNLMKNMNDMEKYYFKFNSDWQASNKNRSEQFVFYIEDDKQLNDVMQRIEKTKKENPKLFEGSKNINPFLKNINGIAYTNEPKHVGRSNFTDYVGLNNKVTSVTASYNNLLSTALEDSLREGIGNILINNPGLGKNLSAEELNNLPAYVKKVLPQILEDGEKKMQLIGSMKKSLVELSEKNPTLDIQGIDKEKQNQKSMSIGINQTGIDER